MRGLKKGCARRAGSVFARPLKTRANARSQRNRDASGSGVAFVAAFPGGVSAEPAAQHPVALLRAFCLLPAAADHRALSGASSGRGRLGLRRVRAGIHRRGHHSGGVRVQFLGDQRNVAGPAFARRACEPAGERSGREGAAGGDRRSFCLDGRAVDPHLSRTPGPARRGPGVGRGAGIQPELVFRRSRENARGRHHGSECPSDSGCRHIPAGQASGRYHGRYSPFRPPPRVQP